MAKFMQTNQAKHKSATRNNQTSRMSSEQYLRKVRKNITRQALLALLTIVLTLVIVFAMTSAWYTNIAQTSGLVFEAEAWGFDGKITVAEGLTKAAPGDDGVVHLTVANNSDAISAISVNINKNKMNEEMQKRLFFYVDTQMNRNDETMERVYLNKTEGYTYNVFGKGQLTLTEQVSNAPVIKWQWVYDVLGYYVLAKPVEIVNTIEVFNAEDGTVTKQTVKTTQMSIKEYLRPIEYNFDEATTAIRTDGDKVIMEITTVDGTTHPEVFLQQLSKRDGYPGEIEHKDKVDFGNYYKVDVDKEGYGVYAYLCNYTDILMATEYDSMLGELANDRAKGENVDTSLLNSEATVILSAQKNEGNTISVNTLGALRNAIDLGISGVIQLNSNITLGAGETLLIPKNARVMLDLNGYILTNLDGTAIKVESGGALTMINGKIKHEVTPDVQQTTSSCAVHAIGAEVVMSKVDMTGFEYGVYVSDYSKDNELDSRVYLLSCNVDGTTCAAFIAGNGLLSEQKSQLIIEKSMLQSPGIVISGNGDTSGNGKWGTDIQIISSKIIGTKDQNNPEAVLGGGIYHPQKNSTLTVYSSEVEGYNGISIKGGHVTILDSKIHGLGNYNKPDFGGSGYTDTGDAVYIETNYNHEIRLEIGGGSELTHQHEQSLSLRVYDAKATNVSVKIESGTFDEMPPAEYIVDTSNVQVAEKKVQIIPAQ